MRRVLWLFYGVPFLVTLALGLSALIIGHIRLGDTSPGIVQLAVESLNFQIPALVVTFFFLPAGYASWLLFKAYRHAKRGGVSLSHFLSMTPEEKTVMLVANRENAER